MAYSSSGNNPAYDGIVCIGGEDWWYHNRGHFDFQIMRRLARNVPVLFVNSLGVRMPSVSKGGVFTQRIARKLKSLSRGLVEAEPGFFVFSPIAAPGRFAEAMTPWSLAPQIRLAMRRIGIERPVLWMHCPAGARLVDQLPNSGIVLQRTDRFEAFPEADPAVVGRQIADLKKAADLVVYAAPHLMAEEQGSVARQLLVTHGVETERFARAGERPPAEAVPPDLAAISGPRVGFIGGIDHHTFDPSLFLDVARRLSDASFVLVGGCSLPEGWCSLKNVYQLGRRPYDEVADYMAGMDVLIMPWNRSRWIEGCNPIKLKEYLAVGRPVVTTDFPALAEWRDVVTVVADAEQFADGVRQALERPHDASPARARLVGESWDEKAVLVARALDGLKGQAFEEASAAA